MSESPHTNQILVVEDEPDLRELITEVLERAGYEVAEAHDGAQALAYLTSASRMPDLILLDLRMPNMDGVEFRHAQLKNEQLAHVPTAMMSGDSNGREKAATLGLAGFLTKPLKVPQLLAEISRVLESSQRGSGAAS